MLLAAEWGIIMKKILFVLVIVTCVILGFLVGCSSAEEGARDMGVEISSFEPEMDAADEPSDWDDEWDNNSDMAAISDTGTNYDPEEGAFVDVEVTDSSSFLSLPLLTPSDAENRRLVYNVYMDLQTTDFQPGVLTLLNKVSDSGGYVVSSTIWGSDMTLPRQGSSAEFRLRIPSDRLADFIDIVANYYNILHLNQGLEEFTRRYQETSWDIADLRQDEASLLEALDNICEEDPDNVREGIQDELRSLRRAIRELESSQATITHNVIYSTVDLRLSEAILTDQGIGEWVSFDVSSTWILAFITFVLAVTVIILIALLAIKKGPTHKTN